MTPSSHQPPRAALHSVGCKLNQFEGQVWAQELRRHGFEIVDFDPPAEVYILNKDEGGRHTPFFTGYKPQFYIGTTDVTGEVTLPEGKEMVMPGDTITFKAKLVAPIALEEKRRFAIREGGKTVGAGVVTKIIA